MKNILFALLIPALTYAQKIERNQVDEFTRTKHIETKCQNLVLGAEDATIAIKVRSIDGRILLRVYWMLVSSIAHHNIYSIGSDDHLMLLLSDSTVISLKPTEGQMTCLGCGACGFAGSSAYGTSTEYRLSVETIDRLLEHDVFKMRMYTSKGYVVQIIDYDRRDFIAKHLKLVLGT